MRRRSLARTHDTNETKRFPGWGVNTKGFPQTSDIYIYIYDRVNYTSVDPKYEEPAGGIRRQRAYGHWRRLKSIEKACKGAKQGPGTPAAGIRHRGPTVTGEG